MLCVCALCVYSVLCVFVCSMLCAPCFVLCALCFVLCVVCVRFDIVCVQYLLHVAGSGASAGAGSGSGAAPLGTGHLPDDGGCTFVITKACAVFRKGVGVCRKMAGCGCTLPRPVLEVVLFEKERRRLQKMADCDAV